jgi:hypothetical protein
VAKERTKGAQPGTDVGEEAEGGAQKAPQGPAGHPDEEQSHRDGGAVEPVGERLHEQVSAHPVDRVVDDLGGAAQTPLARQADDPVSEVFPLEEDEDHEDHDDARHAERIEERLQRLLEAEQEVRGHALDHGDGDRILAAAGEPALLLRVAEIAALRLLIPDTLRVHRLRHGVDDLLHLVVRALELLADRENALPDLPRCRGRLEISSPSWR